VRKSSRGVASKAQITSLLLYSTTALSVFSVSSVSLWLIPNQPCVEPVGVVELVAAVGEVDDERHGFGAADID
jgi:hypothetical protein